MPPTFNDRWLPWPRLSGGPVSRYSFRVGPAAARIQVWPLAPARWLWSAISSLTPIRLLRRLAGLQSPSVARAVSPPGGTRAVSPRVAPRHGPSVPEWRTGRQFPSDARAVSHPEWLTCRQFPGGARAVSTRVAHGPSVPRVAQGPTVPEGRPTRRALGSPVPRGRCSCRPSVEPRVDAPLDRGVSVLVIVRVLAEPGRPSR